MTDIEEFQGEYRWLSNFWPAIVVFDGETYPSVEHAYVAAKSLDPEVREKVKRIENPGQVKRLGRGLEIRDDWDEVKEGIMERLVRDKFKQSDELQKKLLATGDCRITEGNNWGDKFWGVCSGSGENRLGKIIMKVRAELRSSE